MFIKLKFEMAFGFQSLSGSFSGQVRGVYEALARQWITHGDCLSFQIFLYMPLIKYETIHARIRASDFISHFTKTDKAKESAGNAYFGLSTLLPLSGLLIIRVC